MNLSHLSWIETITGTYNVKGIACRSRIDMSIRAVPNCSNCKAVDNAYNELLWLTIFKATQHRDAVLRLKETTGLAIYREKGRFSLRRRCRITHLETQVPGTSARVKWTIHIQDDAPGTKQCDNARLIIHAEYTKPTEIATARVILETLRALWDNVRRTTHIGQAWLQTKEGDVMEYRIVMVTGEYESATGRYTTLAWTWLTPQGPHGEARGPGELAKQLAPGAIELARPDPDQYH